MEQVEQVQKVWKTIRSMGVGMLTTRQGDTIHSRPMAVIQDEFNGVLYFFTRDDSLKVAEVSEERFVGISFSNPDEQTFVSLSGRARVSRDRTLIDRHWHPMVKSYFPEGKDDPNLALLEIEIDSAECWDSDKGKMAQMFEMTKTFFKKEQPDLGEHQTFN